MYEISNDVPVPATRQSGLAETMRGMCKGDSVELPQVKRSTAYSAARLAGIKITVRVTAEGTLRVWRTDGQPRSDSKSASAAAPAPRKPSTQITEAEGGHYVRSAYGPNIFVADENIFGEPIEHSKPNKKSILS